MELTDLRETAALARINMGGEELEKTLPAFGQMLSFFAAIKVTDEMPAAGQPEGLAAAAGCLRPDTAPPPDDGLFESMLSQAPERDGRFFAIPNVL
jgi:Asp-tRNA(Asn)/Glu-tRNA(Gln) amidotransferase C subunit